ncbi:MAG: hflX [Bacteroidetes bacterium]|jgi:GTP-binding protein HflX|nr:hflX [Bacteroidota bacterium]
MKFEKEMKMFETAKKQETAVLVGLINRTQDEEKVAEYLDELDFLAETAGAKILKRYTQRMEHPDPGTFIGSGKLNEIKNFVKENAVDIVIFDDELSPAQQRNLEKGLKADEKQKVKVLDRTTLILDIFAARARTAHAKTQVELAQYQYLLPRLTKMWSHLDRVKGGIGMKGAGEKEIETDRRIIRDRIALLKEKLTIIDKQMETQRKSRGEMIRVALVGYTNVGKSTIMNLLSKSDVFAENKLFATLDTTVRKVVIDNLPFLLSDTVGFIRKLPTNLIESFKSTLDEVREADVLVHVVDISHAGFEDQINVVNQTLADIGASDKPTLLVFNKIDAFHFEQKDDDDLTPITKKNLSLDDLKKTWMRNLHSDCIFISAANKENVDEFRKVLYEKIKDLHQKRYPYNNLLY